LLNIYLKFFFNKKDIKITKPSVEILSAIELKI